MKKISLSVLALLFTMMFGITAFAAATFSDLWYQDSAGTWHAKDRSGNTLTNCWFCDDAVSGNGQNVWYLIDGGGNMISAGLIQDGTGNYYSIETNHNGYYGMLRYQSGTYDGIYLDLEPSHNGSFAAIRNADGIAALQAKYGLTSVAHIGNANIVYSSQHVTTKNGAGGPGGNSSSGGGSTGRGGSSGGSYSGGSSSGGSGGSAGHEEKKTVTCDHQYNYCVNDEQHWKVCTKCGNSIDRADHSFDDDGNCECGYSNASGKEAAKVVSDFVKDHITDEMTLFEKEIEIIRYLVANTDYDLASEESYTVKGALVNGSAACQGYALAFKALAEACGIPCRTVTGRFNNGDHMWNAVKLEDDWYHVDVTLEDPLIEGVPNTEFGYEKLRSEYINLTDEEIARDHAWEKTFTCSGTKYGKEAVRKYLGVEEEAEHLAVRGVIYFYREGEEEFFSGGELAGYTNVPFDIPEAPEGYTAEGGKIVNVTGTLVVKDGKFVITSDEELSAKFIYKKIA